MTKTFEKIFLAITIIAIVGVSSFLVDALNTKSQKIATVSVEHIERENLEDGNDIEDKEDVPITGNAFERASSFALKYIGEGKVTDTEIGDEEGYYEIEITLDNGNEVDVHLNENYEVISKEYE